MLKTEKTFSGLRAIRPLEAMSFLLPVIGRLMEKLERTPCAGRLWDGGAVRKGPGIARAGGSWP